MTKKKKILIIVLSVILGIALILGIWFAVAPREFLQAFLSDEVYAGVTVTQNSGRIATEIVKLAKEDTALHYAGNFNAKFDKDLIFGSETAAKSLSDYASTLKADGDIYFKNGGIRTTFALSDDTSVALSGETIFSESRQCYKFNQLGDKWYEKTKKTSKVDVQTNDNLKEEDLEETEVYITDEKVVRIGSVSTKGEALTLQMSLRDFKILLSSIDIEIEESGADFAKLSNKLISILEEDRVESVILNLFVNKRNHIVGFSIDFDGEEDSTISFIKANEKDDCYAVEFDFGEVLMNLEVVLGKAPFEDFNLPSATDTTPFDKGTLGSDLMNYVLGDFVKSRPELKEAYSGIISAIIGDNLGSLFSSIFGGETDFGKGITSGISGIVEGAMNGDGSDVSGIIGDFFSAFGINTAG